MLGTEHSNYRVKPFICSTKEYADEREALSCSVFLRLRDLCEHRGASFTPYDWDLDLNQEQLDSGLPLQLALDCITAASPYFICIIGNQYGCYRPEGSAPLSKDAAYEGSDWIEKNILRAAESGYSWLLDESYTSTSLFEFKIMQAAFFSEETEYIRFYIHDKGPSHSETDRYEKFKLQQLKTGIANRGLHVTYFKDTNELRNAVWTDWSAIIDTILSPLRSNRTSKYRDILIYLYILIYRV